MARRLIATANTNANGVASFSEVYTGEGAGLLDLVVESTIDGSVVSQPYEITDAIFYDVGTSGTVYSGWSGTSSSNSSSDSTGTTFYNTTGNWTNFRANRTGTSSSDLYDYSEPLIIEYDVVSMSSTGAYIQLSDGTYNITRTANDLGITGACSVKVVYNGSSIRYYVNETEITSKGANVTFGNFLIAFVCNNGNIKFKNFRIYTI